MKQPEVWSNGENLLTLPAVKARVCMGKTKICEQIKAGAFPAHIENRQTSLWIESGVQAWVQRQIKQQRRSPP